MNVMGRFMHEIYDGHGFYSDWGSDAFADSYIAIQVQQVDGEPVVRASADSNINPGDTIVAIDGVSAAAFYEEAMSRYSASSQGYRFVLATDELKYIYGSSKELTLRNPDGAERTITTSGDWGAYDSVPWGGTFRESGMLDDLGAPDVLYVNLNGDVTTSEMPASDLLTSGEHAGVILDMRDYPNFSIYDYAGYFNTEYYTAPIFGHPTYVGPKSFEITQEVWGFEPQSTVYTGPVALLVSNKSVSAAECFSQMLMDLPNVTILGQQSASTNGTITNAWLPGKIQMTWTGMRLLNPDGTEFHGIGVVPDIEVTPTAAEFAAGIDPELQAAIEVVLGQ